LETATGVNDDDPSSSHAPIFETAATTVTDDPPCE